MKNKLYILLIVFFLSCNNELKKESINPEVLHLILNKNLNNVESNFKETLMRIHYNDHLGAQIFMDSLLIKVKSLNYLIDSLSKFDCGEKYIGSSRTYLKLLDSSLINYLPKINIVRKEYSRNPNVKLDSSLFNEFELIHNNIKEAKKVLYNSQIQFIKTHNIE